MTLNVPNPKADHFRDKSLIPVTTNELLLSTLQQFSVYWCEDGYAQAIDVFTEPAVIRQRNCRASQEWQWRHVLLLNLSGT